MTDHTSWQMARIASRRPLPKPHVMHGPVMTSEPDRSRGHDANDIKCGCHGTNVCPHDVDDGNEPRFRWVLRQLDAGRVIRVCSGLATGRAFRMTCGLLEVLVEGRKHWEQGNRSTFDNSASGWMKEEFSVSDRVES